MERRGRDAKRGVVLPRGNRVYVPVGPMLIVGFRCFAISERVSAASQPRALYCRVVALVRLLGLVAGLGAVLLAQAPPGRGNVAPFYPTPMQVAVKMLQEAEIKAGELHYDLGSGDGRLVILAARNFGAKSVGFEIDSELINSSRRQLEKWELGELAEIREQDLFTADFSDVDVVTVYLLPRALARLKPILETSLKAGARIISHDFPVDGWDPEKTVTLDNYDDPVDNWLHTIYVYRRPAADTSQ